MLQGHQNKLKEACGCPAPFTLWTFPACCSESGRKKHARWVEKLKRVNADKTLWNLVQSYRVCSLHFKDYVPTVTHPDPTEELGLCNCGAKKEENSNRKNASKKAKDTSTTEINVPSELLSPPPTPMISSFVDENFSFEQLFHNRNRNC